ncbi:MAG TPA: endonuclease/exonuclease/phosphatase family protein [Sphingobacteriaceae bacterium]
MLSAIEGDLPAIITGDLNATPGTGEILKLETRFTETGKNGVFTFPAGKPLKKIDYILVSKPALKKVRKSSVPEEIHLSDHLPIISRIRLK